MGVTINEEYLFEQPVTFFKGAVGIGEDPVSRKFYVLRAAAGLYRYAQEKLGPYKDDGVPRLHTTLASAIGVCIASRGDKIYVLPGHTETLTATLALNKVGVTIIGLGNGDNRPVFTINAAIPGFNITADDQKLYNLAVIAGASVTAATRLVRVAASDIKVVACRFEMAYDMYHMIVSLSGDDIEFQNCEYINTVATAASVHPQTAFLNIGGTNVLVHGGRFTDVRANKAERWRTCVEGGKLTADLTVEKATFVCRGIATATRSAGASGKQYTVDCRGISPSSNTSVGSIFTPTYQFIIETYNVAAVNKVGVVTVTTSDLRLKTNVQYL